MVTKSYKPANVPQKLWDDLLELLGRRFKNQETMQGIYEDKLALKHRAEKIGLKNDWALILDRAQQEHRQLTSTEAT